MNNNQLKQEIKQALEALKQADYATLHVRNNAHKLIDTTLAALEAEQPAGDAQPKRMPDFTITCGNSHESPYAAPPSAAPDQPQAEGAALKQECDDIDEILRHIGLDPDACRTDGGNLMVGRIKEWLTPNHAAPAQAIAALREAEAGLECAIAKLPEPNSDFVPSERLALQEVRAALESCRFVERRDHDGHESSYHTYDSQKVADALSAINSIALAAAPASKPEYDATLFQTIPSDVINAANLVSKWFKEQNIWQWQLGDIQSRCATSKEAQS